jgi:lactate dehydrogenase-like 2-hydroxyacid dehydrogenase
VPDYCVEEMADSTIALLLALLRGIVALDRDVAEGRAPEGVLTGGSAA